MLVCQAWVGGFLRSGVTNEAPRKHTPHLSKHNAAPIKPVPHSRVLLHRMRLSPDDILVYFHHAADPEKVDILTFTLSLSIASASPARRPRDQP